MFSGTSAQTFKLTASDLGLELPPGTNQHTEYLVVKAGTDITMTASAEDKPNVYVSTEPGVPSNIKLSVGENVYIRECIRRYHSIGLNNLYIS